MHLCSIIKHLVQQAQDHQHISLAKLMSYLNLPRSADRHPLFQVLFNFINIPMPKLRLAGLQSKYIWIEGGQTDFDLVMNISEEDNKLHLNLNYNATTLDKVYYSTISKSL